MPVINLLHLAESPSSVHLLGTDAVGRDALSRIIAQRVHDTKGGNALTTIDDVYPERPDARP